MANQPSSHSSKARRVPWNMLITSIPVAALASWTVFALLVFCILPTSTPSRKADAVVVLAGAHEERVPVAINHVANGVAPLLLVSVVDASNQLRVASRCDVAGAEALNTQCFSPSPSNTRGEAISVARAQKMRGWNAMVVVTSRYHAARTSVLLSQCTDARVEVVVSEPSLRPDQWLRAVIEETGGLLDAYLRPECRD